MPKCYSEDVRKKVLVYLEKDNTKQSASELFQIGIATIYRWIVRKKEKGHVKPIRRKYAYKIIDDNLLIVYHCFIYVCGYSSSEHGAPNKRYALQCIRRTCGIPMTATAVWTISSATLMSIRAMS